MLTTVNQGGYHGECRNHRRAGKLGRPGGVGPGEGHGGREGEGALGGLRGVQCLRCLFGNYQTFSKTFIKKEVKNPLEFLI